jgi:hypothetical protein
MVEAHPLDADGAGAGIFSGVYLYVGDATAAHLQTNTLVANDAGTARIEIRGSPYSVG